MVFLMSSSEHCKMLGDEAAAADDGDDGGDSDDSGDDDNDGDDCRSMEATCSSAVFSWDALIVWPCATACSFGAC